jgi:DNA polymerase-3 subunit epsilon
MNIQLTKPLAIFDLETTGINIVTDRIVEISILKVLPTGSEQVYNYRINPEMPIPAKASEVHVFMMQMLLTNQTLLKLGRKLPRFFAIVI